MLNMLQILKERHGSMNETSASLIQNDNFDLEAELMAGLGGKKSLDEVASHATVLVYDNRRIGRKTMCQMFYQKARKVMGATDLEEVMHIIKRYNSSTEPDKFKKRVSVIVALLDQTAIRILETLRERAFDEKLRGLPLIPVFLVVDPDSEQNEALLAQCDANELSFLAGIIYEPLKAEDFVPRVMNVVGKYDKVETSYKDLSKEEVHQYPKFRLPGEQLSDDENSLDDSVDEFEGLKEHIKPASISKLKAVAKLRMFGLIHNKGTFRAGVEADRQESLEKKRSASIRFDAPGTDNSEELSKFKIADKRHRPTLFKSTPSSSNLLKGKKGDGGGAGATGVSDVKEEAVSRTTVVKDAIVDPSMTPYVYKQKPEVGSPRTASGYSKRKVQRFHRIVEANRQASSTVLVSSHGQRVQATKEEKLRNLMRDKEIQKIMKDPDTSADPDLFPASERHNRDAGPGRPGSAGFDQSRRPPRKQSSFFKPETFVGARGERSVSTVELKSTAPKGKLSMLVGNKWSKQESQEAMKEAMWDAEADGNQSPLKKKTHRSSIMDPFLRIESANDQTKGNRMFQIKKNVLKLGAAAIDQKNGTTTPALDARSIAMGAMIQKQLKSGMAQLSERRPVDMLQHDFIADRPPHIHSSAADYSIQRGHDAIETSNDYEAALIFFNKAVTRDPESAAAHGCRGLALAKLGQSFKAIKSFGA
mmetsp:Transcript_44872/g.122879  ORF Transcript_44872/g.122879 Transcript_44872/m.122879 type:complete len:704 (-) Transcript_44872:652-2763(-)